jgi:hypothetical protein
MQRFKDLIVLDIVCLEIFWLNKLSISKVYDGYCKNNDSDLIPKLTLSQ